MSASYASANWSKGPACDAMKCQWGVRHSSRRVLSSLPRSVADPTELQTDFISVTRWAADHRRAADPPRISTSSWVQGSRYMANGGKHELRWGVNEFPAPSGDGGLRQPTSHPPRRTDRCGNFADRLAMGASRRAELGNPSRAASSRLRGQDAHQLGRLDF